MAACSSACPHQLPWEWLCHQEMSPHAWALLVLLVILRVASAFFESMVLVVLSRPLPGAFGTVTCPDGSITVSAFSSAYRAQNPGRALPHLVSGFLLTDGVTRCLSVTPRRLSLLIPFGLFQRPLASCCFCLAGGCSTFDLIHWAQMYRSKEWRACDWGATENVKRSDWAITSALHWSPTRFI